MKRVLSIFIATLVVGVGYLFTLSSDVEAIPLYPMYCNGFLLVENGQLVELRDIEVGETVTISTRHIAFPDIYDQVIFRIEGEIIDTVYRDNTITIKFDQAGTYELQADVEGFRFVYWGFTYDQDGNKIGGRGPGGGRYHIDSIVTECEGQITVVEKPTPPPTQLTVKNATTGGSFSGSGTESDPYLVPNRTNTRFMVDLMSGESVTAWLVNGFRIDRTTPQFDYTLWRTGDWIFGPEIKGVDGSLREELVWVRGL